MSSPWKMPPYTESALVQQTTADYLEHQLGWESIFAHNKEDFGPDSLLGRMSDREVVLTRILREKLAELNPGLPDSAYDDAVRQITSPVASKDIAVANQEKYKLMRDGVSVRFTNDKNENQQERLRVFDFDVPENNHFLCVRELRVKGDLYRRRADIIGFVNGLPLLFVECKNVHRDLKAAFEENYSDYKDTIPHLFHYNAIVMLGNGIDAKVGSVTSAWEHFHEWKRLAEEDEGAVDMETLLKGVCDKRNFMDLVENFILFDKSSGKTKKILARNHQFLGANQSVQAVKDRKNRKGKLGVFWHTQGGGKSYSMVMLARKVNRKLSGNFTFLVLTDRDDLETQIYETFAGCGLIKGNDPCRASSGEHLRNLLGENKPYIFSLIQKFNINVTPDQSYTQRDDVIVISDEAHRSQYGGLALNMRNALPNAGFIGFTGTPLFKENQLTRRVFGEYVSTYGFRRAVEDKVTVPLYYDPRGEELELTVDNLDERFAEELEKFETEDTDIEQRLERELKRNYHIITAGQRLDQIAQDFVRHYSAVWETGKAMFICIDKITCVRMYHLIDFYWGKFIKTLEAELKKPAIKEEQRAYMERQIDWMKETRMAVVISEEQGEVARFRKWDLDITPHRKLIKEGMDLPEAMRNRPEYQNKQRLKLEKAFKAEEHPFRIAIVCAMWLTGFNVPSLSTLYLDKPLKAHTLMQAIARANRVNKGKNNGLIVDYCGILNHLRRALATFAGTQPDGNVNELDPAKPIEELLKELADAIALVKEFLAERDAPLDDVINEVGFKRNAAIAACKDIVNKNDETRKHFEIMCNQVFVKFRACITVRGINDYRTDHDAINIIYKSLQAGLQKADISEFIQEWHKVMDKAIITKPHNSSGESEALDLSKIDFEKLQKEFARVTHKNTAVQSLKSLVEKRLKLMLERNPSRANLQEYYEKIIAEYNQEQGRGAAEKTAADLFALVEKLSAEENRAIREGLDEESLAVFDLLKKPDLSAAEIKRIKKVARELLETLKKEKLRIENWTAKEATRDDVKQTIHDFLYTDATGLPMEKYGDEEIEHYADEVYRHVFRVYPKLPSPCYGVQTGA